LKRPTTAFEALPRVRIVLHHTSHPGNIGAAARAMKTMGLSRLVLVAPRRFPDREADALAVNAVDLLGTATVCDNLEQALQGTAVAYAFSARQRELSHAPLSVRDAAAEAIQFAAGNEVALVFGNETAGLANEDVLLCNRLAIIPTAPDFSSLNLAAAVQIAAYELYLACGAQDLYLAGSAQELNRASGAQDLNLAGDAQDLQRARGAQDLTRASGARSDRQATPLASIEQVERFYEHLEQSLGATDFLDPGKPKRWIERMRRLFGRAQLQPEEVNILRGMLTAWDLKGTRPPRGSGSQDSVDGARTKADVPESKAPKVD